MTVPPAGQDALVKKVQHTLALARYVSSQACAEAQPVTLDRLSRAQRIALWLQNRKGSKNSDRRAWIEEGKYACPFQDAHAVLQREWVELLLSEIMTRLGKVRHICSLQFAGRLTYAPCADRPNKLH